MERDSLDKGYQIMPFSMHSDIEINLEGTDENELYNKMIDRIEEKIQKNEQAVGTGWRLHSVEKLELHTVKWVPLRGSSYIKLLKYLEDKKAIINMKNEDDKCLLWCVLRALYPKANHPERLDTTLKSKIETLNMDEIKYPVSLKDINKFEKQNPTISISVLGYSEEKKVYPLVASKYIGREHDIVLMLICNEERKHYCLVNDLSRLLGAQTSRHLTKRSFCLNCFKSFNCENSLNKHTKYCSTNECMLINMPEKGSILNFKNYNRSEKVTFVVYADFESLLEQIQTCSLNPESSYTKQYQKHKPVSYCYYIVCSNHKVFPPLKREYVAKNKEEDIGKLLMESLEKDIKIMNNIPAKKMIYRKEIEGEQHEKETRCWICKGEFDDKDINKRKVRDHCHFTGKYRGAAYSLCNRRYRKNNFTPVIFHNLSGYDSHLFIKSLGLSEGSINCIPNNDEKYISFSKDIEVGSYKKKVKNEKGETEEKEIKLKHTIRFIDSYKFMAASLDSLVNNLPKDDFINLRLHYSGNKLNLLAKKGVYPYEYMEETQLPPKEKFYSRLNDEDISDEDYEHAKRVWEAFNIKTLRGYLELYNEVDVLLLADVFENFRDICLENYKLDPAHYFTAQGLAWDACLNMTKVKLELLTDIDMLLMVEKD